METHIATRKDHRCTTCGRRIPIGARYFSDNDGEFREHTNCLDYKDEPMLNLGYNHNRKLGEVDTVDEIDNFGKDANRD